MANRRGEHDPQRDERDREVRMAEQQAFEPRYADVSTKKAAT